MRKLDIIASAIMILVLVVLLIFEYSGLASAPAAAEAVPEVSETAEAAQENYAEDADGNQPEEREPLQPETVSEEPAAETTLGGEAQTEHGGQESHPEKNREANTEATSGNLVPVTADEVKVPTKPYYIEVRVGANNVVIYTYDENGEYTIPLRTMTCSTGGGTPKTGTYDISKTRQHRWHALFGHVYGQYCTQITGTILFHSVPYTKNNAPDSLEYWEFDKLGTSASMGCVRLQVKDAKWIYENRGSIAGVTFLDTTDVGPLGKAQTPKISDNELCRGWDPTDPDADNPWNRRMTEEEIAAALEAAKGDSAPAANEESTTSPARETETAEAENGAAQEDSQTEDEYSAGEPEQQTQDGQNSEAES